MKQTKKSILDINKKIRDKYNIGDTFSEEDLTTLKNFLLKYRPDRIGIIETKDIIEMKLVRGRKGERTVMSYSLTDQENISTNTIGEKSEKIKVVGAFREAIAPISMEFRFNFFKNNPEPVCPLTGIPLVNNNTHIDHYDLKFVELVSKFMELLKQKKNLDYCDLVKYVDNEYNITNEKLKQLFINFHNKHTHLRAIHKTKNLELH